ncbi:MAG TPA: glucosaminidase domain-containing protein [Bryobacteraceae bacterium]|nr:glucosaminidase domain-containing protein [Bryobacteraceae bacterium]
MPQLTASVGRQGRNHHDDVQLVQDLLNLNPDGLCGPQTIRAIEAYQRNELGMDKPDGRVDPGGRTFRALCLPRPKPTPGIFPPAVINAAINSQTHWAVPASVTLAQWALESSWGASMPPGSNNPFGIKAAGNEPFVESRTHEVIHGRTITITAKFRKFDSLDQAFFEHGSLLANSPHYHQVMALKDNPTAFADALTGVYATAPNYGTELKSLMQQYNLCRYEA